MAAAGESAASPGRTAAFFDLDKTIIAKSSTMAFSKPFQAGGLISRRSVLRSTYAQFVYVLGGADHDQMEKMRAFMSTLVAGWDVATVREIVADTLHNIVDPLVYDEAVSLIEEHKAAGRDVIIVSTSGTEVVEPIGAMLGADIVVATRLEVVDGQYTGDIEYYAYAEEKARAILELAELRGYDLDASFGYSDSVTDVPMLEVVGHPHAVNPDKDLRKVAVANGWPVLVFTKPVALQSRVSLAACEADHRGAGCGWCVGRGWRAVGQREEEAARGLTALGALRGERLAQLRSQARDLSRASSTLGRLTPRSRRGAGPCRWHPSSPGSRVPPLTRESWATRRATSNCCPGHIPVCKRPLREVDRRVGTRLTCGS